MRFVCGRSMSRSGPPGTQHTKPSHDASSPPAAPAPRVANSGHNTQPCGAAARRCVVVAPDRIGRRDCQKTQHRNHPCRRSGLGRSEPAWQCELEHAEHRFVGAGRSIVRAILRLSGLLADARRVFDRPLSSSRRRVGCLVRGRAAQPRRDDDRRRLPGRRLRDRLLRQMAQRHPIPLSPSRPWVRRVLRILFRPLGRIFQSAAGSQRPRRARKRVYHRRPDGSRARVHRAAAASGRFFAICRTTRPTRRCRCRTDSSTSSSMPN